MAFTYPTLTNSSTLPQVSFQASELAMGSIISLLFFLLLGVKLTLSSPPIPPIGGGGADNTTKFIRASCRATHYPNLCFHSLSRYASAVQESPLVLARVAANVTLARVRSLSSRVSTLCKGLSRGQEESGPLRDCASTLDRASGLMKQSAEELGRLDAAAAAGGPEVAWRVENVQTWVSAALTYEDTCNDGFERVGGPSKVKAYVCGRVRVAERFTSNALALVNSLVAPGRR